MNEASITETQEDSYQIWNLTDLLQILFLLSDLNGRGLNNVALELARPKAICLPLTGIRQDVRVPSANHFSLGKVNPACSIQDTVKGKGGTSRTAALRSSKVLEISKQMETSAIKPQELQDQLNSTTVTRKTPQVPYQPSYCLINTDLLAQHLPLPQEFLFQIPLFFLPFFSFCSENLIPAVSLQCIIPSIGYPLVSYLQYSLRPFPPTACSEMSPVPALLRSTIFLIYSSHPISYHW